MQKSAAVVPEYYMPGRDDMEPGTNAIVGGDPVAPKTAADKGNDFFGNDGLSFADLLDVLNPLQHLPVIGDLYRSLTGDQISPGARMAGGTLYGGPLGFVSSLANTVVEEATGKDIGGNMVALFSDSEEAAAATTTASAPPVPGEPALASLAAQTKQPAATATKAPAAIPARLVANPNPIPVANTVANTIDQNTVTTAAQKLPALSPAAFQTLMTSINGPAPQPARPGLTAGSEEATVKGGSIREAGMEINRLLRPHADGN